MKRSITALFVACSLLAAGSAAPLAVSETALDAEPIEISTTAPESYHYWHFGSFDDRLSIGTGVRTLVADLDLPVEDAVRCWASTSGMEYFEQSKTEAEWRSAPTIALPDDFAIDVGDTVEATCITGDEEYYSGFYIRWSFTAETGTAESLALPTDPAAAWSRHSYDYVSPENPTVVSARPGDAVRVTGPAGTFLPDQPLSGAFGPGNPATGYFDYLYFSEDAAVSPDGSTLTFTLPTTVLPLFEDEPLYARFATGPATDEFPDGERSNRTVWWGGFDLDPDVPQATSSSRVGLSLGTALSFQRVRATAVISAPDAFSTAGPVTFLVDGKAVATADVTAASNDRATVLLPRLPRGRHVVTVEFGGSEQLLPSTSRPAALRILL